MLRLFFFQAEDGIRDLTVTGVQTCALPISPQDQSESCRSIAAPSTMWRRHPFITSESCVHRRTRFRGTLFSHNWAMGGSAYSSRTVTLRDRYSSGLMSTRLYLSSMDSRPAPG